MVTDGLVFISIAVSLGLVARILRRSSVLDGVAGWPLIMMALAILTILPTQTFGQREHIALVELLPALAVLELRARRENPPLWAIIVAGLGAGLALAFKPYFAIGLSCGVAAVAIQSRSWRIVIAPENAIAAGIVAIYVLCIAVFCPEFFTVIGPLVRDVYWSVGLPLGALLAKPAVMIWALAAFAALLLRRQGDADLTLVMLLATSLGFAMVFLLQRKGWPYHSYPMIALALLALGTIMAAHRPDTRRERSCRALAMIAFGTLFAVSLPWFDTAFDARPLQAPVARLGPHPKILAITAEPGLGHPLVRALDGVWVSRQQAIWVAGYLRYLKQHGQLDPQQEQVLNAHADRERAMLIEDVRKNSPTVVLVDNLTGDGTSWLQANPDVADLLKDYRVVETVNGIDLMTRAR